MTQRLARRGLMAAALSALPLVPARAQSEAGFPARPVRLVVGFPPGSAADVSARIVAAVMAGPLGQAMVVENRPGAGSTVAAGQVARAAPDGYTVFLGSVANAINASLQRDIAFDFARDFTPVAPLVAAPNILVVHPSVPAASVGELIALLRRRPEGLFYGSSGVGTAPHLSGELFNLLAGVRMTHVPYPGSAQAVTDLVAGRVGVMFSPASTVLGHIREGRLRPLASAGPARAAAAPELPTMEEAGLPGFTSTVWFGLVAPAGTPAPVVARLAAAARTALADPETARQLAAQGFDILPGGPEELRALIAAEIAKWARVIEAAGARAG
ncbi:tripartite tricarboxylate transporter substrate binding protein [Caldovatus aquaticus]|uniref:Tripartite tricarboxylate transporter substrate binding protein n=1 Tax=Caldovatus aquaticus TaxID=2865671 RepID=A0ABS7F4E5_9PROT|nr:tripartite tricarboxylate transporter substrate binding protein [Caldovatus aquaticus]MBW8270398.1 tripartite tricarboxylate transporter substrate binding protein [Caldovatus aquaticus]